MQLSNHVLLNIPPAILCLLMVAASATVSIFGTVIFHRFVPHRSLKVHNDITGPIFSTIGVIYAVLLAFIVVITWQGFDRAKLNAEMEVNSLINLYVDSLSFKEPFKQQAHEAVAAYTRAIVEEWDTIGMGGAKIEEARVALEKLIKLYNGFAPQTESEKIFFSKSIDKLNRLLDLRIFRLTDAGEGIHPLLWFVLIAGGLITISFTIFFGADNLNAKIVMSTLLATLIALVLFTILEFSLPFNGSAVVSNNSFKYLLTRLDS